MKQTKLSIVKAHMARNEWQEALRLAAKFPSPSLFIVGNNSQEAIEKAR